MALHDVDPAEIGDAHAIHLFSGIFTAEADATSAIAVGDTMGVKDGDGKLTNSGTLRQLGIAMDSLSSGTGLIRVIST